MGQRATIAFVDTDQSVKLTSVQWSTRIDQTLGHMANNAIEANENPTGVIADMLRMITDSWNHISALEINDQITKRDVPMGYDTIVSFPQSHEPQQSFANRKSVDIYNWHLDGSSIGVIYDMATPDKVEFFWRNSDSYAVESRKCSISALAKFYNNVKNKPNKLKKFSFREGY